MLRALALLLLLLNLVFFSWTQGWLDEVVGIKARGDREPERMARQVHPERIKLLSETELAALQSRTCLALGPLDGDAALQAAQAALEKAGVAPTTWQAQTSELAGVWAVATIKMPNRDFQARKEETYKKLKIEFEFLKGPPDELPTLLLTQHSSEKAAEAALDAFDKRSLKGLRVLQLQAPMKRTNLVFPQADGALSSQLMGLKDAALAAGFKVCQFAPVEAAASAPAGSASAAVASAASAAAAPRAPASAPVASAPASAR
jgi:hypothetical protein